MDDIRGLLAAHMPGYEARSIERLGEGWINVAYDVNGELIVRLRKEDDPMTVEQEARVLEFVAGISPLPVPRPAFVAPDCLAYFKVPGAPLVEVLTRRPHLASPTAVGEELHSICATLASFLRAVQAAPLERAGGLVKTDAQPLEGWLADAAELYTEIRGRISAKHGPAIEAFFAAAPPAESDTLVFSHNDLGIEHVLVDPASWQVTGIIDWGDAAITDPAYDYGLLYRDLGVLAFVPEDLRERAVFYARCSVFEDLAYGLEHGRRRYVDQSLVSMEWLFPAS